MKLKVLFILLSALLLGFMSCNKESGEGGTSTITGRVFIREYNGNFTVLRDIFPAAKEDVYIIYGGNIDEVYGDQMETDWNGRYEFKYLQKGKYIIYAYSKDSTLDYSVTSQKKAIVREVEITGKNQTIVVPAIEVLK